TYMRTDAVRVSQEAQDEAKQWVGERLGREYLPDSPPGYKTKKSAQDAHEAVRPSSVAREPKALVRFLSKDQLALYRLIWERFLASQMLPAVYDTVAADIQAGHCMFRAQGSTLQFAGLTAPYIESRAGSAPVAAALQAGPCMFRAQGSTLKFAGFPAVYIESREATDETPEEEAEAVVPPLQGGESLEILAVDAK